MRTLFAAIGIQVLLSISIYAQSPKIEYLAHASFIIESAEGTRVLIDPYHSYHSLGYVFPDNIDVDFVLITHPHFDHDASKYFSANIPVFRDAGNYQFNDITFRGVASEHGGAEFMGPRGLQVYNTIWVVEVDGIKVAHFGDNRTPTPEDIEGVGEVDFMISQPNDEYYSVLKDNGVFIPNHHLHPEITDHTNWMQSVTAWVDSINGVDGGVKKLASNTFELTPENLSNKPKMLVFKTSAIIKAWSEEYTASLEEFQKVGEIARSGEEDAADKAIIALDKVIELAPNSLDGYFFKASFLSRKQEFEQAISILEQGLARVPDADWGREVNARNLLANAYHETGRTLLALDQYRWIVRHDRISNLGMIKAAREYIEEHSDN